MTGTRVGPYQIVAPLGHGGMGIVYRALDVRLKRHVALKLLPEAVSVDPARRARFEQEAQLLAALNHPRIAHIYGLVDADDSGSPLQALAMEIAEGEDLSALIARGALPVSQAVAIARQIADALAYAHRQGIIHRDLKPANIKVAPDGSIKILDFGLAKLAVSDSTPAANAESETRVSSETMRGVILGSPGYLSPEQAHGQAATPQTDVWSFGAVLFEMLTGTAAFPGESAMDRVAVMLHGAPAWERLPTSLSDTLRALIQGCLQRDLTARIRTFADVRALLDRVEAPPMSVAASATKIASSASRSIVVLPFSNLSADNDNAYFSDGLTEEIIADLSKVRTLRVISRTSAMRLKGNTAPLSEIARMLDVRYVLDGSVRKAGSQLRITAQLTDVDTDACVWADKYSGSLDDVFEIQERVSRAIVDSLRIQLTAEDKRRLERRATSSGYAFDAYLRARRDILSFSADRLDAARRDLAEALAKIGDDVLLLRAMGYAAWQYINAGLSTDRKYLDEAERCAHRILALDPDGPHGPALLGLIASQSGNPREWVRQLTRATDLNPSDTDALGWLSIGWYFAGRPERARPYTERLRSIDPYSDWTWVAAATGEHFGGEFDAAATSLRRALELAPDNVLWPVIAAEVVASAGQFDDAIALLDRALPDPSAHSLATLAAIFKAALRGDSATVARLATPEFEALMWSDFHYTYLMAESCALVRDHDNALRWLERSFARGNLNYPFVATLDPLLASLRDDARFDALAERIRGAWERFPALIAT